jgi:glucosamine kinase
MSTAPYVFAIDGGGSKTVAALLTVDGTELARCRTGPANLYRDPVPGLAAVAEAWQELCARAGLDPARTAPTTVVSAGFAGVSGAAQRQAFRSAFAHFATCRLSSDGYTAFLGVFGQGAGALLSIGTGVIAYRRGAQGPLQVRSGWGFPVADRGSGAWLGLRLVAEYLDWLDGAAAIPGSRLWTAAEERLGRQRETVLAWLKDARAAEFATLAPAVIAAAREGDALGRALLVEGAGHLRRLALALEPTPAAPLALGGGLAEVYRPDLRAELEAAALVPAEHRPDPIRGAWLVATGQVPPEFPDVA